MGRPLGARNQDYEATRRQLATKLRRAVVRRGPLASLHDLAREAEVSIPTVKHYFKDRSGAVAEALRSVKEDAGQYVDTLKDPGELGLFLSLRKVATDLAMVWVPMGVGQVFTAGLAAGVFDEEIGPGYIDGVLEPTVIAVEERLRVHARRGELRLSADDELGIRTASLGFVSPLLVALIHQHGLHGTKCRPLDVARFIERHVEGFVSGYGLEASR